MRVGLLSDTHGHLPLDAIEALSGCDQVIHAGDIGQGVLEKLTRIAPVIAVRGNNDYYPPESSLPERVCVELEGKKVCVVHRMKDAPPDGWDILVYGHSHRSQADRMDGRLSINPGSAGRSGFHDRRTIAILTIDNGVEWEFLDLGPRSAR